MARHPAAIVALRGRHRLIRGGEDPPAPAPILGI